MGNKSMQSDMVVGFNYSYVTVIFIYFPHVIFNNIYMTLTAHLCYSNYVVLYTT